MKIAKKIFALLLVVSLLTSMLVVGASAASGAQIVSQQLSLGDDLTMRFYVTVDSQHQADAVISIAVADQTPKSYPVAEMTAGENGYCVSVDLAAPQMNDNIAVTVTSGETVLTEGNYSIRNYCQYLLNGNYDDATKNLVKEVLNYGAKAQVYFDYNVKNLANAGNELETAAPVPMEGYDMTMEGQLNGISLYGVSLVLESKIAVRYYFQTDNIDAYTFTVDGTAYEADSKNGKYCIEVPGINPQSYADAVELTVSDGTGSMVVGYSPMSYMVRMCAKDTASAELKSLLSAMYGYYLKAKDFVGIRENDDRVVLPVHIIEHEVIGTWADAKIGSASLGPQNSYDGNLTDKDLADPTINDYWNPEITDFMSDEGIIYTLDTTYDLTNLIIYCHRIYYFTLYGSSDGVSFDQILRVGSSNAADYYTGEVGNYICDISGIDAENVKYLKIVFTGCANIDATHVAIFEVELSGKKPFAVDDGRMVYTSSIIDYALEGSWVKPHVGDSKVGPEKSYDGDVTTKWNPQITDFISNGAIVYTLDSLTELTKVTVTFDSRWHYFDLSVSADGSNFTHIARVNAATASKYFDEWVATIDGINTNAKYIRIDFLGTANNTTYISLNEVSAQGKAPVAVDDGRTVFETPILSHAIAGTWANDREGTSDDASKTYDGNTTSNWNPAVSAGFKSGEAVIYTLDNLTELTKVELTFGNRLHYFDLSVSADGSNFTHIARVNATTASKFFNGLVATVDGINTNAKYIRIDFLGTENNTTWISLMEVSAQGKVPFVVEDSRETVGYSIIANSVEGTWEKDRVGDTSIGPEKSYDDSVTTIWNPQATTNYQSGEAIVYTLDKAYDLDAVSVTFGSREYFFDLSVSGDGINYTHIARVDKNSMSRYYNGLVATINGIGASGVKYIKLSFLGANTGDNTKFIALADVKFTCKEYVADNSDAAAALIVGNEVVGTWVKSHVGTASAGPERSYDGIDSTNWNPQATNFKSGEGIVYTLDKAYDLTQIKLTFGTRLHYFDLYVSADGTTYLPVASITAGNAADYYDGRVATVDNLTNTNIVYIKVMFTGTENGTTFINLLESEAAGK